VISALGEEKENPIQPPFLCFSHFQLHKFWTVIWVGI